MYMKDMFPTEIAKFIIFFVDFSQLRIHLQNQAYMYYMQTKRRKLVGNANLVLFLQILHSH